MVLVSVIVPTYDDADVLPRAIDSVLDQSMDDWELIVVDDHSPDDTGTVVESYSDERIHYIRHEQNRGGSAARNTGIDAAAGDYVAFLDSDDVWDQAKLERQIRELERRGDAWRAVYCRSEMVSEGHHRLRTFLNNVLKNRKSSKERKEGGDDLIEKILLGDLSGRWGSTLVVERTVAEGIDGFDPDFDRHQDLEFVVRLLQTTKMAYIDETLAHIDKSSPAPATVLESGKEQFFEAFTSEISELERRGVPVREYHNASLAKRYFLEGNIRRGVELLRASRFKGKADLLGVIWAIGIGLPRVVTG